MGLFDTIRAELKCPDCQLMKEREIQTKRGPSLMETYYKGDTIEPFYFGDYWLEEEWYCEDCHRKARETDENAKMAWHKSYIHCINGLIVEVASEKGEDRKLPAGYRALLCGVKYTQYKPGRIRQIGFDPM